MSSSVSSPAERRAGSALPRGRKLWTPKRSGWNDRNTDGLFACEFIEASLRLTRGTQRGQLVRLRHWQGDLICDVFRLDPKTGRRKYRTYEFWVPRKNGKSLLASGLALDGLFDEPGAEVYSCAADKDQAKIVFSDAKQAVEASEELSKLLRPMKDVIEYPATGSVYRALSSEAFTKEGLNPSRVLFDEVHAQPNDELWNVMSQGFGTREQPLLFSISTFGSMTDSLGTDSLGYSQYEYCRRVISGEAEDPSFGCRIYEAPGNADHLDEKVWHGPNPALGDYLQLDDMRAVVRKLPEADFRTKRLNIWTTSKSAALPYGVWAKLARPKHEHDPNVEIVLFFDGSWSGDSTGIVGCTIEEIPHLFLVDVWGNPDDPNWRVPIPDVEARIRQACSEMRVVEVACDPYRWQRSLQALEDEGLPIVEFPNSLPRMIPAWQTFYEAALDGRFTHDGSRAVARHVDNMVLKSDARGVRPVKESKMSRRHIDLGICAVGAHASAVARRAQPVELSAAWA